MEPGSFLIVLAGALFLDFALGDPSNRWHPVAWMGALIGWSARTLPTDQPVPARAGGGVIALAGAFLVGLVMILARMALARTGWVGPLVAAILLNWAFSVRGLLRAGIRIERYLAAGELGAARAALGRDLVSRPTCELAAGQVASGAIESLAENLTDSVVAPLLAFALGGLPAAWAYRYLNTADAMIGYRDGVHQHVGWAAARLDDFVNWLPARLTGVLVVLASGLAGRQLQSAWQTMTSQHRRTDSPNAGWTMAAAAGGLDVRLEKQGAYQLGLSGELPGVEDLRTARTIVLLVTLMATIIAMLTGTAVRAWL